MPAVVFAVRDAQEYTSVKDSALNTYSTTWPGEDGYLSRLWTESPGASLTTSIYTQTCTDRSTTFVLVGPLTVAAKPAITSVTATTLPTYPGGGMYGTPYTILATSTSSTSSCTTGSTSTSPPTAPPMPISPKHDLSRNAIAAIGGLAGAVAIAFAIWATRCLYKGRSSRDIHSGYSNGGQRHSRPRLYRPVISERAETYNLRTSQSFERRHAIRETRGRRSTDQMDDGYLYSPPPSYSSGSDGQDEDDRVDRQYWDPTRQGRSSAANPASAERRHQQNAPVSHRLTGTSVRRVQSANLNEFATGHGQGRLSRRVEFVQPADRHVERSQNATAHHHYIYTQSNAEARPWHNASGAHRRGSSPRSHLRRTQSADSIDSRIDLRDRTTAWIEHAARGAWNRSAQNPGRSYNK